MCGTTNEICHPDFEFVLPCGCCPCKYQVKIWGLREPLGKVMELAKSIGHQLIVWQNTTPGEEPIDFKIEKLPEPLKAERQRNPAKSLSSRNPKPVMKISKRVNTQSERTAARKMKKRQLQQDEIAAKRTNNISTTTPPSSSKTQLKHYGAQATVPETETLEAVTKMAHQKKKPKTHFRKTKKPGRA